MEAIYCDICPGDVPMVLEKRLKNSKSGHRVRRFVCSICGSIRTIFGGQGADRKNEQGAIDTINNRYKKEERNRNEKHDEIPLVKRNRPDTTVILHSRTHKGAIE